MNVMKVVVYALVILLAILHQDFWFWDSKELVFGFMPIGLAYHTFYSIICACVWGLAVRYAWPSRLEHFVENGQ